MPSEIPKAKQVVDEVSGWLRVFDDGTVDRTWTGPPEALFLMEPVLPYHTPRDGVSVHDVDIAADDDGRRTVRVYLPEIENRQLPVIVHLHGGGFCISHATWFMYHHFYSRLARTLPAIVISPFLPLAPEHPLPAAIDASYAALLWLRTLARGVDINVTSPPPTENLRSAADFSRVFLIGDSSGGNLVHKVAARAGEATESDSGFWAPLRLAGGIPIHPGFVRSTRSRSELELKPDPMLTLDMLDKFLGYALPEGATKDHPITCPMGEAAPPLETMRLPPFLVAVADRDLIRDTNFEYCEAMRQARKDIEVVVSQGVGHSFYLNTFAVENDPVTGKRTEELIMAVKDFVERH